jgi:CRP-like cAMP-binding protein
MKMLGDEQAATLSAIFGGGSIYVPKFVGKHHPLAECLGHKDAMRLVAEFGGHTIPVPIGLGKRARILQLREAGGLSTADIARMVGCSRRTVFYVYANADRETRGDQDEQLPLF